MTINAEFWKEITNLYEKYNKLAEANSNFYFSPKLTLMLKKDLKLIVSSTITKTQLNINWELVRRLNQTTELALFINHEKIYWPAWEWLANDTTKVWLRLWKDIWWTKVSIWWWVERRSGDKIDTDTWFFSMLEFDMSNLVNDEPSKSDWIQTKQVKDSIGKAKFPWNIQQSSKMSSTRESKK